MGHITRTAVNSCLRRTRSIAFALSMSLAVWHPQAVASEDSAAAVGPTTAVGLPPAQEANCKRLTSGPLHDQCLTAASILAVMSGERRSAAWADGMELVLRKWIESRSPHGYTLRNVECRLSWCVVEAGYTVAAGDLPGQGLVLDSAVADKNKIFKLQTMFARDPDDANVQDVVVFFKRYCQSVSELLDGDAHLVPNYMTLGQTC